MSAFRSALGKATVAGACALLLVGTACYLAIAGKYDQAAAFGSLVMLPLAWLYRLPSTDK